MDLHNQQVRTIQERVRACHAKGIPFRIYHGATNSTRSQVFDPDQIVDTSGLNRCLSLDREAQTLLVEPNVPMDELVKYTLQFGLVPPVVPEFPGITVGGSFCGTAAESSSFKHGFFDRTVNWMDVVLADGETVRCSPTQNEDLFHGSVGAFGTLGVATLFELQLQKAGKYVEVTYLPVRSFAEAVVLVQKVTREAAFEFVDGVLFSRDSGAIIVGRSTNRANHALRRFTRPRDPWFYLHVKQKVSQLLKASAERQNVMSASQAYPTETVPLADYLFRYDRGAFWMGSYGFQIFRAPFNGFSRMLVDPLMRTRKMYQAMHHSGHASRFIIQDLVMPMAAAKDLLDFVDGEFGIYPIWLCPIRGDGKAPMHRLPPPAPSNSPRLSSSTATRARSVSPAANLDGGSSGSTSPSPPEMHLNIGVWGPGQQGYTSSEAGASRFIDDNKRIERRVRSLGGIKWLYAQTFYSDAEFWRIYDRKAYDALREKWRAGALPTVWDKVRSSDKFPEVSAVKGVARTLLGRDHILARKR